MSGKVVHTEKLGSDSYVFVDIGADEPFIVRENGTSKYTLDDVVHLKPQAGKVHRFDDNGRRRNRLGGTRR